VPVTPADFAANMEAFVNGRLFEALDARPPRDDIGVFASSEAPASDRDW